ncbi:MAG: uroporphyrinogen decarboxylase family protein [Actinobacteria bacterium]|nr:uroporphyrinogen decarboxylase family protein [Actinomycetota bacterium]
MNARTRYLNSLLGGKVDRFFRYEIGAWPSTIERWKREGMPENVSSAERENEHFYKIAKKDKWIYSESRKDDTEIISFYQYFHQDDLLRLPIESGYCDSPFFPKFEEVILEEGINYFIVKDVDGITKKIWKDDPDQSMPQFLEFPVKSLRDWEKVKGDHLDASRIEGLLGDIKKISEDINEMKREFPVYITACGGFGHPRNLMGIENLCCAYYDEPEMVKDIMQNWFEINKEILRLVTEYIKFDNYLIWEDMSYKNGPLISPKLFEEFILPYYAQLIDYAKSRGIKAVMVDTDGDCRKLIPLFLKAGVDAMMPFEVQAGMDVTQIRKDFGNQLGIIGGIDKRVLTEDKNAIKKELDRVIPFFLKSGRFIPCLDHTVPVNVPLDNFKYYLEYKRSFEDK